MTSIEPLATSSHRGDQNHEAEEGAPDLSVREYRTRNAYIVREMKDTGMEPLEENRERQYFSSIKWSQLDCALSDISILQFNRCVGKYVRQAIF